MKNYVWFSFCLIAIVLGGAGCANQKKNVQAPVLDQVMGEYDQAVIVSGKEYSYTPAEGKKTVSVVIPSDWVGMGPIWRPKESSMSNIRVAMFAKEMALEAWNSQQEEDVHQVLKFVKQSDRYLLIVYHSGLKAVLVKMFVPDPNNISGYTFGECRISDDQKSDQFIWNACKTALESIK